MYNMYNNSKCNTINCCSSLIFILSSPHISYTHHDLLMFLHESRTEQALAFEPVASASFLCCRFYGTALFEIHKCKQS